MCEESDEIGIKFGYHKESPSVVKLDVDISPLPRRGTFAVGQV
jgi:hypothetical protein